MPEQILFERKKTFSCGLEIFSNNKCNHTYADIHRQFGQIAIVMHLTTALLLVTVVPVWAGDSCNMDIIRMENYAKQIQEDVQIIQDLNKTNQGQAKVIAEYRSTVEALNKSMQEQGNDCKQTTHMLNRTIQEQMKSFADHKTVMLSLNNSLQEQGEDCKTTIEALNKTIQQVGKDTADCMSMTDNLENTIQDQEAEMELIKSDVEALNMSEGEQTFFFLNETLKFICCEKQQ